MNYASFIDHTYLKPEARAKDIDALVQEAIDNKFKSVCVNSCWAKYVHEKLIDSGVDLTVVVGFPLGAAATQAKVAETKLALEHGANEIDMVINIGKLKDGKDEYVLNEIKSLKALMPNNVLKVIVETALLTKEEIYKATEIVLASGADFVKTSTGFSFRGASADDIKIMKEVVGDKIGIKASGGVKTLKDLQLMVELGATRIGTSSGVAIVNEADGKSVEVANDKDY